MDIVDFVVLDGVPALERSFPLAFFNEELTSICIVHEPTGMGTPISMASAFISEDPDPYPNSGQDVHASTVSVPFTLHGRDVWASHTIQSTPTFEPLIMPDAPGDFLWGLTAEDFNDTDEEYGCRDCDGAGFWGTSTNPRACTTCNGSGVVRG